ncbi:cytokinesis protein sepA [Coprinopsis cinerea AmutBmut pab1-1]|nr:cytokinesis protein sepA [Coprinopsis cinerea AmutBmut pab1-1]
MVKLIQIERLGPRIEGMLYRVTFDETWSLLDEGAKKLSEAGKALLEAKRFKELMSLILLIGNYMNGTGIKGGAFGFRVSSINKLVDTKSVNNTTLLHFLEKTVSKHFPEMEEFLDELEKPAEAYRVNLQDLRKGLAELRDGLKTIRTELTEHFADPLDTDKYGTQMWSFLSKASRQVDDLIEDINNADTTFTEAVSYYGEDDRNMTSSEFYGIFKTFLTSYRKCKADNLAFMEQKNALEKRKQMMEEAKQNRQKIVEVNEAEGAIMDALLEKLRNGDTVRRRHKRTPGEKPAGLTLTNDPSAHPGNETAVMALDMLARLQSDGFIVPPTPTTNTLNQKRRRRRTERSQSGPASPLPSSPLAVEVSESFYEGGDSMAGDGDVTVSMETSRGYADSRASSYGYDMDDSGRTESPGPSA